METKSLQVAITGRIGAVHVHYFLTDFDGIEKSSFGKLYLIARVGGPKQVDIAEVVDEKIRWQEAWVKGRVEETVRLYFQG